VESVENQTQVSLSFPRPLEISYTPRHFHIPTATTTVPSLKTTKPMKGSRPLRGLPIPTLFQDRLALETLPRFRIILGLKNAFRAPPSSQCDTNRKWLLMRL
jgi:hypothetical protein